MTDIFRIVSAAIPIIVWHDVQKKEIGLVNDCSGNKVYGADLLVSYKRFINGLEWFSTSVADLYEKITSNSLIKPLLWSNTLLT